MAKHVTILTEKPSASRNFQKALGGKTGTFEGEKFEIVHARGHLFGYPQEPEKMAGEDYKSWSLNKIPWNPSDFEWKKYQSNGVKNLIDDIKKSADKSSELVIATDDDPSGEGQLIAWEIIDRINYKGKITRMYFVDESPEKLREAFRKREEIKSRDTDGDLAKAETRAKFDYLSMQYTRAASLIAQQHKGWSATSGPLRQGRLKSVMTSLVGEQEDLVNDYVEKPYYTVRFKDNNGHEYKRSDSKEERKEKESDVDISKYTQSDVVVKSKTTKRTAPGKLLDLAAISSSLAPRGFNPKSVLSTYQKMYEQSILSYPRTEDKTITHEQFNELLPLADKIAQVVGVDTKILTHKKPRPKHVQNKGSHGANRPGPNVPKSLKEIENKFGKIGAAIYTLVAKNYLAILCEDYVYEQEKGYLKKYPDFTATANTPVSLGFKEVFDYTEEKADNVKPLGNKADPFIARGTNPKPQNPTMKWLTSRLEKFNVGTGATRTSTLSEITKTGKGQIMNERRGVLSLTETGRDSYIVMKGTKLSSPEVTEDLFNNMEKVGEFKIDSDKVVDEITALIQFDLPIMQENAKSLEGSKQYEEKEKATGIFKKTKEEVSFNKVWSGHEFTEEEIKDLLNGKEITITATSAKTGKEFKASGSLKEQTYKKRKFWGFKPKEFIKDDNNKADEDKITGMFKPKKKEVTFKKVWSGHEFTEKEIKDLLEGKEITFEATSKKGNTYTAKGKLQEQKYKGFKFWGFKPDFS